jgi:ABC-type amino acid transport system permease subunit
VPEFEILNWLISFFTTILAAFIGFLIAVKKFKKEWLWQKKYETYQDILSALEVMIFLTAIKNSIKASIIVVKNEISQFKISNSVTNSPLSYNT